MTEWMQTKASQFVDSWERAGQTNFTEIFGDGKIYELDDHLFAILAELEKRGHLTRPKGV